MRTQLPSGRARKASAPLQLPPGARVAAVLLGSEPGFLQRFLSSRLLRRGAVKAAVAARNLRLHGRAGQHPSPGYAEAAGARKAGLVQRTALPGQDLHGLGFALDLTPAALAAMAAGAGLPPAQRHALVLGTLADALSAPGLLEGYDHVFTVAELAPGARPPAARLLTQAGPRTALDHLLREMVTNGEPFGRVVRDPSLFLLLSPDGRLVARLDPASPRTSGRYRELAVLAGLEKLYAGHELTEDEADYVGAPSAEAALARPAEAEAALAAARRDPVVLPAAAAFAGRPGPQGPAPAPPPRPAAPALPAGRVPLAPPPREPRGDPARAADVAARSAELRAAHAEVPFPVGGGVAVRLGELLSSPAASPLAPAVAPGEFLDPGVARPVNDAQVRGYLAGGHYDRDLAAAVASLADDPELPLFLVSAERRDTSTPLDHKETVSLQLRGPQGRATQLTFDLPRFSPDGYLRIGGVKYNVTRQILARPVIKIREDEVLVTTSYNKAIVARFGQVASPQAAYVRSLAAWVDRERPEGVRAELGSAAAANSGFVSPVEYDNVARTLRSLVGRGAGLVFSRPAMDEALADRFPWFAEHQGRLEAGGGCAVGWVLGGAAVAALRGDGTAVTVSRDGSEEEAPGGLAGLAHAVASSGGGAAPPPSPGPASRRYAYSRVRILSQWLPAAVICGHQDGLAGMLERAGVEHRMLPPGGRARGSFYGYVDFSDATLAYDARDLASCLLVNGLKQVEDPSRPVSDYGQGGLGWAEAAAERLGSAGRARALRNLEASFVDPVAAELLREDGIPADLSGVILYASSLLTTNQHLDDNDMSSYRIRSGPELVPALLYRTLHREMERVRATRESAVPQRLSVAQNAITREMATNASNVEEVADLNPLLEAELRAKASWTGAAGGQGGGDTVTRAQRSYHPSMRGIFGYYSPDSAEIGVKRTLAFGAAILDTRGRLSPGGTGPPPGESGAGPPGGVAPRYLGLGELMSPFTSQHADPPRIGMQAKQATHTLPVRRHTPLLVGSGVERALPYALGQTFVFKSRKAGAVRSVDAANELALLDYDDGSTALVDLSSRSVKNSGGGWHASGAS